MKISEFKKQIRENIIEILSEVDDTAAEKSAVQAQITAEKAKIKAAQEKIANLQKGVSESKELKEMAKIKGELESAIKNVINSNSSLEGLPLKKAIKNDPGVISALGDDDLYDNQLNKFIALVKGERELGQRGRPAMEKPKMEKPSTMSKTSKPTLKNDEEEEEVDTYYRADDEFGSSDDDDVASSIEKSLKKVKNTKDDISTKKDEYKALVKQMKNIADKYKASSGEEAKSLVSQLKDLTKEKKRLEAILNPKIDDEDEF
jgi:predicted  nucleic acid-binding Zn-ribbon protein